MQFNRDCYLIDPYTNTSHEKQISPWNAPRSLQWQLLFLQRRTLWNRSQSRPASTILLWCLLPYRTRSCAVKHLSAFSTPWISVTISALVSTALLLFSWSTLWSSTISSLVPSSIVFSSTFFTVSVLRKVWSSSACGKHSSFGAEWCSEKWESLCKLGLESRLYPGVAHNNRPLSLFAPFFSNISLLS